MQTVSTNQTKPFPTNEANVIAVKVACFLAMDTDTKQNKTELVIVLHTNRKKKTKDPKFKTLKSNKIKREDCERTRYA